MLRCAAASGCAREARSERAATHRRLAWHGSPSHLARTAEFSSPIEASSQACPRNLPCVAPLNVVLVPAATETPTPPARSVQASRVKCQALPGPPPTGSCPGTTDYADFDCAPASVPRFTHGIHMSAAQSVLATEATLHSAENSASLKKKQGARPVSV